jgi:hypothetical protein
MPSYSISNEEKQRTAFKPRLFSVRSFMAKDEEISKTEAGKQGQSRGERARQAAAAREEERKAKAAAKLRENLMRRKSQARARRAGEADETQGLPAVKTDESS